MIDFLIAYAIGLGFMILLATLASIFVGGLDK